MTYLRFGWVVVFLSSAWKNVGMTILIIKSQILILRRQLKSATAGLIDVFWVPCLVSLPGQLPSCWCFPQGLAPGCWCHDLFSAGSCHCASAMMTMKMTSGRRNMCRNWMLASSVSLLSSIWSVIPPSFWCRIRELTPHSYPTPPPFVHTEGKISGFMSPLV